MKTTLALLALLAVAAIAGALARKSPGDGCTPDACLMKQTGVSMTLSRRLSCCVLADFGQHQGLMQVAGSSLLGQPIACPASQHTCRRATLCLGTVVV